MSRGIRVFNSEMGHWMRVAAPQIKLRRIYEETDTGIRFTVVNRQWLPWRSWAFRIKLTGDNSYDTLLEKDILKGLNNGRLRDITPRKGRELAHDTMRVDDINFDLS